MQISRAMMSLSSSQSATRLRGKALPIKRATTNVTRRATIAGLAVALCPRGADAQELSAFAALVDPYTDEIPRRHRRPLPYMA
ncbi:MAG: hypothetical protein AB7O04_12635, partial [Hyphomonadaceae bacterium]